MGYPPIRFRHNRYHTRVENLMPGQAAQLLVPVDKWTDEFTVTISNVTPELPPAEQNQLFGDDVIVTIMDAPTSFDGYKLYEAFVNADSAFPVPQPQTGIARVTVTGDWTNAGRVSADVSIERVRSHRGLPTAWGKVAEGDVVPIAVDIPDGVTEAEFDLSWVHHWGRFPTNDLDMILVPPVGDPVLDGATLASPERVVVENPLGGKWYVLVDGFLINEGSHCGHDNERFSLRVTADGVRIR